MINQYYLDFVSNLAPITMGLVLLIILRTFSYSNKKITILEPEESKPILDNLAVDTQQAKPHNQFIDFVKDGLIINGISPNQKDIEKAAFEKLSILPCWNLRMLASKRRVKELSLFANIGDLHKIICVYSPPSGIVLAHILSNSLRVISYA